LPRLCSYLRPTVTEDLFLSFPETCAAENVTVVYGVEGESISINCTYSPREHKWREKSWCKHISETECRHVVSARRFWLEFLKKRNGTTSIADNIYKGVLTVTIKQLQKQDAGLYQCKTDFLGKTDTLQKVKVEVLGAGIPETEVLEEPRAAHTVSSSQAKDGFGLLFLVAGFLSAKFLAALLIFIIARRRQSKEMGDRTKEGNEHQLYPLTEN
uniref:Ig-like domain-containing protein n=1 Tax=Sphenodon punctatus TaxID=8508 RepID=A0A8D0H2Y1_SPHPU